MSPAIQRTQTGAVLDAGETAENMATGQAAARMNEIMSMSVF